MRENPVFSRVLKNFVQRKQLKKSGEISSPILCFSITRFSGTQQKSLISCWVRVLIIHCSPALTKVELCRMVKNQNDIICGIGNSEVWTSSKSEIHCQKACCNGKSAWYYVGSNDELYNIFTKKFRG